MLFNNSFKKYFLNTSWLILEKLLRMVMVLFVWAHVIRYLGPEHFGLLSFATSLIFMFTIFVDLGLEPIVVKELIEHKDSENAIMGSIWLMKFFGACIGLGGILMTCLFLKQDIYLTGLTGIMALSLIFQSFLNIDYYFQARVMSRNTVLAKILAMVIVSILFLCFIKMKYLLLPFATVWMMEFLLTGIFLIFYYCAVSRQSLKRWRFESKLAKAMIIKAWPLIVSGVALSIYMRIDQIMIQHMLGPAALGYYAAAVRATEAFYFIPMVISSSLFPSIIKAKQEDEKIYKNRVQALFSFLFWIACGVAVVISIFSPQIVHVLFGREYALTTGLLRILVWAGLFVYLGVAQSKYIITENLQVFMMNYMLIGAGLNALLNLILIPLWGIKGAALTTLFTQFFVAVFLNVCHSKTRPIFILQMKALNPFSFLHWKKLYQ